MAKGGGGSDIIKEIAAKALRDAKKAASKAASKTAGKAAASSRAARKEANKAESAARREAATAVSRADRAERKAINSKRYKSMQETGVAQEYGYGNRRITKAKEYYADELDKIFRVLEGTDRTINVSGKRRNALVKELRKTEEYLAKEGYGPLTLGEKKTIVKDFLTSTKKANTAAEKRLTGLVEYTKGLEKSGGRRAIVDRGAARALQRENRRGGKTLPSILSDEVRASRAATTRKLEKAFEKAGDERLARKANAKIGTSTGKKQPKKVVEQESSKRLRSQQETNIKKGKKAVTTAQRRAEGARLRKSRERDLRAMGKRKPKQKMGNIPGVEGTGPTSKRKINIRRAGLR